MRKSWRNQLSGGRAAGRLGATLKIAPGPPRGCYQQPNLPGRKHPPGSAASPASARVAVSFFQRLTDDLRKTLLAQAHASGYVFGIGEDGKPPTQQAASLRVAREMKRLKLTGVTHHTMRHTGVTLMLEAGRNPRAIQKLAGWSSLRMLERYGHARDAELRGAVSGNAEYLAMLKEKKDAEAV